MYRKSRLPWRKDEQGATAVEFAFMAVPFFIFLIGIIEVSLVLAHSAILEGATHHAARLIRTGQIQQNEAQPELAFHNALCQHATIMECDRLQYSVRTIDNFSDAGDSEPIFDEEGNMEDLDFIVGGSGEIVMIRVSYVYRMMTPLIGQFFANAPDNGRFLYSTIVLRTEPYEFEL